ncbi:MAG TPA: membrane protein insertion efficiency factor YidD [Actinomycetota bacterium]
MTAGGSGLRLSAVAWASGWPARQALLLLVRGYRLTLGKAIGGGCRFHPSCSAYAEQAIGELGALRGTALSIWRVVRCSPLTVGGVDYPPKPGRWRSSAAYDDTIHRENAA